MISVMEGKGAWNCFSVKPDPKRYTINDDISFIELLLDAEIYDNGDILNPRDGFVLAVNEDGLIGKSNGYLLFPGKAVSVEITPTKFNATYDAKQLKYSDRKCIFDGEFELMDNMIFNNR